MIHMGTPRAAGQLISGFHDIENHAWRWNCAAVQLVLRPPPGIAHRDAVLTLNLTCRLSFSRAEDYHYLRLDWTGTGSLTRLGLNLANTL